MKNQIIIFEFRKLIKEKVFFLLSILLLLLTLLSIYTGSKWSSFQINTVNKIEKDQREKLNEQIIDAIDYEKRNDTLEFNYPLSFTCYLSYSPNYFVTEPHPNSIFSIGQSDLYPNYIRFKRFGAYTMLKNYEIQNPLNLLIGKLDFYFLLVYIIPLFIIVIAFDTISIEKELGTLKMLKVYHPSTIKLFINKFIFRYLWFTLLFFIGILIGLLLFSPFPFSSYSIIESIIGLLSIALYLLFWFSLAFFINSLFRSSTFNGVSLVVIWLVFAFAIPTAVNSFISYKHPTPSKSAELIKSIDVIASNEKRLNEIYDKHLAKNPNYIHIEKDTIINKLRVTKWYTRMAANFMYFDSISMQNRVKIIKPLDQQHKKLESFKLLSPALIIQSNINILSRNDYGNFRDFQNAFISKYSEIKTSSIDKLFKGKTISTNDFKKEGNFYKYKRNRNINKDIAINMIFLFIICLVLIVISFILFKKSEKSTNF